MASGPASSPSPSSSSSPPLRAEGPEDDDDDEAFPLRCCGLSPLLLRARLFLSAPFPLPESLPLGGAAVLNRRSEEGARLPEAEAEEEEEAAADDEDDDGTRPRGKAASPSIAARKGGRNR
jgi:hypothetical protein